MLIKLVFCVIVIFSSSIFSFGQKNESEQNSSVKLTAPIKWERYKVSDNNISISFPKMPVKLDSLESCKNRTIQEYGAYADGVAYILTVISKSKTKIPEYCEEKEEFNEQTFEKYLSEKKQSYKGEVKQIKEKINKFESIKLSFQNPNRKWKNYNSLINDYKNKSIYEFTVINADESKKEVRDFIESLRVEKKQSGFEIGDGSLFVIGDETLNLNKEKSDNLLTNDLIICLKPKPGYTEAARQNNVTGTVRLRVTFNANGSVSSTSVVKGLPDGLTEQAIAAVKKIIFIPKTVDNERISVSKIVEYSFTIY